MLTPRTFRGLAALSAAALLTVIAASAAQADAISNDLDTTIDATAEVMALNVDGDDGTTTLYVAPANGDGKNGCNLTGATTVTISLASDDTGVATVSPASVTFTSCGDTRTVVVSPVGEGTARVTATVTGNTTGGAFNVAPVAFSVTVAPPANTAPTVAVAGVVGGAAYPYGSVPAATCVVTDEEDGGSTFPATLSAVSGPDGATGIGSVTASCSYTDAGGLTASASETYSVADGTAPVVTYAVNPTDPDGTNGWYRGDVSLTWTVIEAETPASLTTVGCDDQAVTVDQDATVYTCEATSPGGTTGPVSVTIKRDGTAPIVYDAFADGELGDNGWYVQPVQAYFGGLDSPSGIVGSTLRSVTSVGEGSAVVVESPEFADDAGNTTAAGAVSQSFRIDLTNPDSQFSAVLGSSFYGSVPAAPTCEAIDAVSGPASCVVTGYSTAVGTHTLTATAKDNAGRTSTATQTYTVLPWTAKGFYQPVDMNGVLNSIKGGSTVPVKFELFAGATELTDTGVVTLSAKKISCTSSAPIDDIEVVATGATTLRYDATAGQFVYNWKTPTGAGTCYALTMTADDGSTLSASFKLK